MQGYERYDVLIHLAKSELFRQPDLSLGYAKEAQNLAEEAGNNQEFYIALKYIGMSYVVMGNSEKAIGILSELLEIFSEPGEETEADPGKKIKFPKTFTSGYKDAICIPVNRDNFWENLGI